MRHLLIVCLLISQGVLADTRYCGAPLRNTDGSIHRSTKVKYDFQHTWPCPATNNVDGACPGWSIDHVIPLACGGCDSVENMQWLKNSIKSCAGKDCKDRWERKIYCGALNIR